MWSCSSVHVRKVSVSISAPCLLCLARPDLVYIIFGCDLPLVNIGCIFLCSSLLAPVANGWLETVQSIRTGGHVVLLENAMAPPPLIISLCVNVCMRACLCRDVARAVCEVFTKSVDTFGEPGVATLDAREQCPFARWRGRARRGRNFQGLWYYELTKVGSDQRSSTKSLPANRTVLFLKGISVRIFR